MYADARVEWSDGYHAVVDGQWHVMCENGRWNVYSATGICRLAGSGARTHDEAIEAAKRLTDVSAAVAA